MLDNTLWVEKYRPKKVDDIILPASLKKKLKNIEQSGDIPNMIFAGSSGTGKTTAARALAESLDCDYLLINASEDNGIDVLRTRIRNFASSVSLNGGKKLVILDEADYLPAHTVQVALRGFIEEFSSVCRFILTCNFKNRIIDALQSRCPPIDFNFSNDILQKLCGKFHSRLKSILDDEEIKYDEKVLAELIMKYVPDWRRILNECQGYANTHGEIVEDILYAMSEENMDKLFGFLKNKKFSDMRKWVANNVTLDGNMIMRQVYDYCDKYVKPESVPEIVVILADYMYKAGFVADKELNLTACLTEIMSAAKFK